MIKVSNLTKFYGNFKALENVSFEVGEGKIVGLLGPNGAGKTTTMRIVTGILPMSEGEVTVDGVNILEDSMYIKSILGYLPENPPLYPEMTVEAYLLFTAKLYDVPTKLRKSRVEKVMEETRITDRARKTISTLSKGYKQRVGIAQALVHDPKVIILDEPTIGLDPNQIREIRKLIKEMSGKRTVILSTHILPEVSQTCEDIIIIAGGKIVAHGTEESLTSNLSASDIRIKVQTNNNDKAYDLISKVGNVKTVSKEGQSLVVFTNDISIKPQIAKSVIENGLDLKELSTPELSLEEVFQKFTTY